MKKVTECKDCGGIVSASATTCPHCGAKRKPRTKLSTWIIGGLFMTGIIMVVGGKETRTATCPPLDPVLFKLDQEHAEAASDFMAKAERLRSKGICPMEGSFGKSYNKFYFAVHNAGENRNKGYFIRLTREELKR